ncbi:hypothetical protein N7474_008078 [Penicillium riverlandense]|uniref:uncharacterized protein n=1 Tax=Penicillium riverlandense TaxID=1903569 RepID=UPI002548E795|nr:uncharacterized protein N7474_008078 [Penicillium riverlandense]KAJ5811777.1 hypothetical protein N7474_008078 [Penicillium riverlandense]
MAAATTDIPAGWLGNLNASQKEKLGQFWRILMQSWDPSIPAISSEANGNMTGPRRFFSLSRRTEPTEEEISAIPENLLKTLKSLDANATEIKAVGSLLSQLPGDELRAAYLTILKQDHPDALCLRFLRAEKWNVPKAWIKFVRALNWRVNEFKVDTEVLLKGEEHNLAKSRQTENLAEKKDGEGFVLQLQTGKGHYYGADKWNRPICIIRVRLHNPNEQTQKGLNDYIIQCCETARLLMVPPVDTMSIVFDLTSFSLSNWDFPPVKFIVDCFQENYPESLGAMIFYNAPWIFSSFWKIIHGILDPVVASKVHFISGAKELEQLVPKEHIIKELGGEKDWEYEYVEPAPQENDKLKDTDTRDEILARRKTLGDELFSLTTESILTPEAEGLKDRRDEVIKKLRENYWELDPFVRSRTILDRTGVIKPGGKIDFYPEETQTQTQTQTQTETEPEKTSVMTDHVETKQSTTVAA